MDSLPFTAEALWPPGAHHFPTTRFLRIEFGFNLNKLAKTAKT